MESLAENFTLCKFLDPNEDHIVDTYGEIFKALLTLGTMKESKQKLFILSPSIPDQLKVVVNFYTLEPSYLFPEFVQWSVSHYSVS